MVQLVELSQPAIAQHALQGVAGELPDHHRGRELASPHWRAEHDRHPDAEYEEAVGGWDVHHVLGHGGQNPEGARRGRLTPFVGLETLERPLADQHPPHAAIDHPCGSPQARSKSVHTVQVLVCDSAVEKDNQAEAVGANQAQVAHQVRIKTSKVIKHTVQNQEHEDDGVGGIHSVRPQLLLDHFVFKVKCQRIHASATLYARRRRRRRRLLLLVAVRKQVQHGERT